MRFYQGPSAVIYNVDSGQTNGRSLSQSQTNSSDLVRSGGRLIIPAAPTPPPHHHPGLGGWAGVRTVCTLIRGPAAPTPPPLRPRDRQSILTRPPEPRNRPKSLTDFGETVLGAQEELGGVLGHPRHPEARSDRISENKSKTSSPFRSLSK